MKVVMACWEIEQSLQSLTGNYISKAMKEEVLYGLKFSEGRSYPKSSLSVDVFITMLVTLEVKNYISLAGSHVETTSIQLRGHAVYPDLDASTSFFGVYDGHVGFACNLNLLCFITRMFW
ncbi:hypothetical protein LOK49_LG03G01012 [Camellia lanceoleosa]|uniref:Uncharacterized protein n=1 Tax=Camellia lanceoleosa TaxID=1840588 RepID=A0ACC0IEU9_9ERIC|nr:hypothetical protein LOK49_LG03G01012 [Camellia lanceoleosa]